MEHSGYILNFTEAPKRLTLDQAFQTFEELPGVDAIPETPLTTLYIIGHAVPDRLIDAGKPLPEDKLADKIVSARKEEPTLIIWDVCFARSFQSIKKVHFDSWGPHFAHIFACQDYERTWHDKDNRTLFSEELPKAVRLTKQTDTWSALQTQLRKQFGSLQTPEVVPNRKYRPSDFNLPS